MEALPKQIIYVHTNARAIGEAFQKLAVDQLPFATAVALTRVAQDARDTTRGLLHKTFTLRAPRRVKAGISINRAEKKDWPNCFAEVGIKDEFMAKHVLGGKKMPLAGTDHIAIPSRLAAANRGPGGGIIASLKPRRLRTKKTVFVTSGSGDPVGPIGQGPGMIRENVSGKMDKASVQRGPFAGQAVISPAKAASISRLGTVTWFLLRREVTIKKTWPFPQQCKLVVGDRYEQHFKKEYEAACNSVRKQAGHFTTEQGRFFYLQARKALGPIQLNL